MYRYAGTACGISITMVLQSALQYNPSSYMNEELSEPCFSMMLSVKLHHVVLSTSPCRFARCSHRPPMLRLHIRYERVRNGNSLITTTWRRINQVELHVHMYITCSTIQIHATYALTLVTPALDHNSLSDHRMSPNRD